MIGELLTRIRFLLFRKKRSEFDEELRFHLEQSIAEKVAGGASAAEARRPHPFHEPCAVRTRAR